MSNKAFRAVLFYVLLIMFCATAALTILGLVRKDLIQDKYLHQLFTSVLLAGIATLFALFKQLNGEKFGDPPDVNGLWEYECVRQNNLYKHGGTCEIELKRSDFGWEFKINGRRTWRATKVDGAWQEEDLDVVANWHESWGTFTGSDSLRYAYSVILEDRVINGYGWATLVKPKGGKPQVMDGNFYQLPPHDPFYGRQLYWRPGARPSDSRATRPELKSKRHRADM